MHQHYGRMKVIKNNIFDFEKKGLCCVTWGEAHLSAIFENNILITDGGYAYHLPAREHIEDGTVATGNNILWSITGEEVKVFRYNDKDYTVAEASALGMEVGSICADPKCKDLSNFDFTLAEDSPAYALGFKPIQLK